MGDRLGDVRADEGREHGFFSDDTRFISRWVLRVSETPLELLSLNQSAHFDAQFFLTPTVGPDEPAPCSIVRHRLVDHVWMEEITVTNHLHQTCGLRVVLEVDTDFADLFEVKDGVAADRAVTESHDDTSLTLAYRREAFRRSVTIAASASQVGGSPVRSPASASPTSAPAVITRDGFAYTLELAAGERWSVSFTVSPHAAQPGVSFARRQPRSSLEEMRAESSRARDVAGPCAGVADRGPIARSHLPLEPQRSRRAAHAP